jgi:hypothetical protein
MTDDLIKRLREADTYNKKYYAVDPLHQEAADRIEELVKGRERLLRAMTDNCVIALELEAKLEKAMEALRETGQAIMVNTKETSWRLWGEGAVIKIRNVLAELEKTK